MGDLRAPLVSRRALGASATLVAALISGHARAQSAPDAGEPAAPQAATAQSEPSQTATPQATAPAITAAPSPAPAPSPAAPTAPVARTVDTSSLRVDYNAPDPHRSALNHVRAAANVAFANYAVFQFNWFSGEDWSYVTHDSLGTNLRTAFQWDGDKLPTNFFEHPYHGGLYFTAARATGLGFWESVPYSFLGSLTWELFGETQAPSANDLIATTMSGIVLGESLYRLSSELLDDSTRGPGRLLRELGAAAVSPMRGFNRLYMGTAWQNGPAPDERHVVQAQLQLGIDRVRTANVSHPRTYNPTALAAVAVEYGDLLPRRSDETLDPFDFFDFYGAANFSDGLISGAQVYAQGLLYGWSADISSDKVDERDNDVVALVQSYDFQAASVGQFGGMSLGPGNYLIWRFGPHRRLRIGVDTDWTFLAGVSSPYATKGRDYNFTMGAALGTNLLYEMGPYGTIGMRSKQYLTAVVDGEKGEEVVGYVRVWYNLDVISKFGVGVSPTLVHRRGSYDNGQVVSGTALETQVYVRVHD